MLRSAPPPAAAPPEYGYIVVREYPHDPAAFTQGLEFRAGLLVEGTGLNGSSSLRKVDLETGRVRQQIRIDERYFGEGITVLNGSIFQLTWQSQTGFVYLQDSLQLQRTFSYPGEGWGLTNDGRQIFMSDGSDRIRCWDGATLRELRSITVHDHLGPVKNINELEFVKGEIYANIWQSDRIARISPKDGRVTGYIDLSGILPVADRVRTDVLNGIAYDSMGDRLFVTGKLWPKLFQIRLVPKGSGRRESRAELSHPSSLTRRR